MKIDRETKIVLAIIGIFVLTVTGLYLYNKQYSAKYTWGENFVHTNDQPYGTKILYNLLKSYSSNKLEIIEKQSASKFLKEKISNKPATYFIIGNYCNYDVQDINVLDSFVKAGNTVFMSLNELPGNFISELCLDSTDVYYEYREFDTLNIFANFMDVSLKEKQPYKFYYEYLGKKELSKWTIFQENIKKSKAVEILGLIENKYINYIRIPLGEGQILMHSNPIFFTNLHLIRPEAASYTEKVFSYLPEGPIYWDHYSKIWSYSPSYESNTQESPFSYILSHTSFKWAFYLMWVSIFIFLFFNLWRKQKAIPVIFPKSNSTLEFIHTIGELYFSKKDNKKLALQKMDLFLKNLRIKYHINENNEEKFIGLLSKKSEMPETFIQSIFDKYHLLQKSNTELSDKDLIQFYKQLEYFHKKSK